MANRAADRDGAIQASGFDAFGTPKMPRAAVFGRNVVRLAERTDRMRTTAMVALTAVILVAAVGMVPSGDSGGTRVAVLNLAQVFDRYHLTKDLEAKFDEKRRAMQADAQKKQSEIQVKREALSSFKPGSQDYKSRRSELTEMQIQFEVWARVNEQELRDSHKQWLLKIYHDVRDAVAEVAEQQSIDVVLTYETVTDDAPDSEALRQQLLLEKVFYYEGRLDLTDRVVERVNARYKGPESIRI